MKVCILFKKKIAVGKIQESPERDKGGKIRKELKIGAKTEKKELSRPCGNGQETQECIWKFTNLERGFTYVLVHHRNDYCRDGSSCALLCASVFLFLSSFTLLFFQLLMKNIKAPKHGYENII